LLRVLPAARRARGLPPAARPGGHRARPAGDLGRGRRGGRRARRRAGRRGAVEALVRPDVGATAEASPRPVVKPPVWTPEIPLYFYTGGLAGGSAGLALLSDLRGEHALARRAWLLALAGCVVSPALLISDLGVPSRFLNMLR